MIAARGIQLFFLAKELPNSWENFNPIRWVDPNPKFSGNIVMEFDGENFYLMNRICESELDVSVLESEIERHDCLVEWPDLSVRKQWNNRES